MWYSYIQSIAIVLLFCFYIEHGICLVCNISCIIYSSNEMFLCSHLNPSKVQPPFHYDFHYRIAQLQDGGKYWRIDSHSPMFYLPIFSLPVIYSIGAYFDNLVRKLSLLICYNKTWQPLTIAITVSLNVLGYFLLHTRLNIVTST